MLENIKQIFSINDLSAVTNIEKGTIRIWEKRYQLLHPKRTDTNIRYYDLDDLKKLMNVQFLLQDEVKISHIAKLSEQELELRVQRIFNQKVSLDSVLSKFLYAVITYDVVALERLFDSMENNTDFKTVYLSVVIPLLQKIGILWQTNTVDISHEHFLVQLIKQKMYHQINQLSAPKVSNSVVFILFLPENEIHEIGLVFLQYVLKLNGIYSIVLGPSVPMAALEKFFNEDRELYLATHISTSLRLESLQVYFDTLLRHLSKRKKIHLWVSGGAIQSIPRLLSSKKCQYFESIEALEKAIEIIKNSHGEKKMA